MRQIISISVPHIMQSIFIFGSTFIGILLISGCNLTFSSTQISQPIISTTFPTATPAPIIDNNWELLDNGLEWRVYTMVNSSVRINVLRIDPNFYTFRSHYQDGNPLGIRQWQDTLSNPIAIINTNFFTVNNTVLGLLISDGQSYGISSNRGGTFAVQNGIPFVRSNLIAPYQGEPFEQAIQAFPMLIVNGQSTYTNTSQDQIAPRTIIAEDAQGRILLMTIPLFGTTLHQISAYLPTTDMNIINALNLDGGGSTMMFVAPNNYELFSFDPVPAVLAVYRK